MRSGKEFQILALLRVKHFLPVVVLYRFTSSCTSFLVLCFSGSFFWNICVIGLLAFLQYAWCIGVSSIRLYRNRIWFQVEGVLYIRLAALAWLSSSILNVTSKTVTLYRVAIRCLGKYCCIANFLQDL